MLYLDEIPSWDQLLVYSHLLPRAFTVYNALTQSSTLVSHRESWPHLATVGLYPFAVQTDTGKSGLPKSHAAVLVRRASSDHITSLIRKWRPAEQIRLTGLPSSFEIMSIG